MRCASGLLRFACRSGAVETLVSHKIECAAVVLRRLRIASQSHLQIICGRFTLEWTWKSRFKAHRRLGILQQELPCFVPNAMDIRVGGLQLVDRRLPSLVYATLCQTWLKYRYLRRRSTDVDIEAFN